MPDSNTPVLVGVSQLLQRTSDPFVCIVVSCLWYKLQRLSWAFLKNGGLITKHAFAVYSAERPEV